MRRSGCGLFTLAALLGKGSIGLGASIKCDCGGYIDGFMINAVGGQTARSMDDNAFLGQMRASKFRVWAGGPGQVGGYGWKPHRRQPCAFAGLRDDVAPHLGLVKCNVTQ